VEEPGVLALRQWRKQGRIGALAEVAVDREAPWESRFWATKFLGSVGDSRAIDTLVAVLGDSDEGVRSQAAKALGSIGDARAVPALARAAFDRDSQVRISAVIALGEIGDSAAIAPLNKVAQTTSWGLLHEWATGSLAKLNAPEAADLLIPYLDGPTEVGKYWMRRVNKKLRWTQRWAAKHLERLGTRDALGPLERARRRDLLHRPTYTRAIKAIERRHPRPS
jgi:HEAT repeat protein